MRLVSEIKLIRTDTTLDLSQKAEKVCFEHVAVLGECGTGVVQSYDWDFDMVRCCDEGAVEQHKPPWLSWQSARLLTDRSLVRAQVEALF